jgi:hypothetical protein
MRRYNFAINIGTNLLAGNLASSYAVRILHRYRIIVMHG